MNILLKRLAWGISCALCLCLFEARVLAQSVFTVPNSTSGDDTLAVQAVIDQAAALAQLQTAPVTVIFPADQIYRVTGITIGDPTGAAFTDDLIVKGNDSELRSLSSTAPVLTCSACIDLDVYDLTLDFEVAPFTQGRIVEIRPTSFVIEIDAGFSELTEPRFAFAPPATFGYFPWTNATQVLGQCYLLDSNGVNNNYKVGGILGLRDQAVPLGNSRYELTPLSGISAGWVHPFSVSDLTVNDYFVIDPRDNGVSPITAAGIILPNWCERVSFENVRIYSGSQGMRALHPTGAASDTHCTNVSIVPRAGDNPEKKVDPQAPDRVWSVSTDGFHLRDGVIGTTLAACTVKNIGDDPFNFGSEVAVGTRLLPVSASQSIIGILGWGASSGPGGGEYWLPGDVAEVIDGQTGEITGTFTILATGPGGIAGETVVLVDHPLPNIRFWIPGEEVGFPWVSAADKIVNASRCGSGAQIVNCSFDNALGLGRAPRRNATIANNTFTNIRNPAIDLTFKLGVWSDAPIPDNVLIADNAFFNCMWAPAWTEEATHLDPFWPVSQSGQGVIDIGVAVFDANTGTHTNFATTAPVKNISIVNNAFAGWGHHGIRIINTKQTQLAGNMYLELPKPFVTPSPLGEYYPVFCKASEDVQAGVPGNGINAILSYPTQQTAVLGIDSDCSTLLTYQMGALYNVGQLVQIVLDLR